MSGAPTIGRVVVAGGAGAVGSLFAERLQESGNDVVIVDLAAPGPAHRGHPLRAGRHQRSRRGGDRPRPSGRRRPAVRAGAGRHCVAIGRLAGALRPDALIADTLSVKATVVPALRAAAMVAGTRRRR